MKFSIRTVAHTAALAAGMTLAAGVHAAAGDFDTSFSSDGRVIDFAAGYQGEWRDILPLGNGRVVAVGTGYFHPELRFAVPVTGLATAYNASGAVDTTWGNAGNYIRSGSGAQASGYNDAVALAGGKVLLAGTINPGLLLITRLTAQGLPDDTFGTGGHVTVAASLLKSPRIAARSDGSFVIAAPQPGTGAGKGTVHVFAFTAAGVVDTSFDGDGTRALEFTGAEFTEQTSVGLALDADGKVLVGATEYGGGGDIVVYRLHTNGSNDASFDNMLINQDGRAVYSLGNSQEELMDLAVQPDGKVIIVGAYRPTTADTFRGVVIRANSNGRWDEGFGNGGSRIVDLPANTGEFLRRVMVQGNGGIVAVGNALIGTAYPQQSSQVIVRLDASGNIDTGFATDGALLTGEPVYGSCMQPFGAALDGSGNLFIAGESMSAAWQNTYCASTGNFSLVKHLMPTPDTVPPAFVSVLPASGSTGVKRSTDVRVTFDENLDPASVTADAIQLFCDGGIGRIAGTVSYVDSPAPALVFTPEATLPTYRTCTAWLTAGGASDMAGNAIVGSTNWAFRTVKIARVISVTKTGRGAGTVYGQGAGPGATRSLDCGTKCSASVLAGNTYHLTAVPAAGSHFVKWLNCPTPNGATCVIPLVNRDRTVQAVFQLGDAAPVWDLVIATSVGGVDSTPVTVLDAAPPADVAAFGSMINSPGLVVQSVSQLENTPTRRVFRMTAMVTPAPGFSINVVYTYTYTARL